MDKDEKLKNIDTIYLLENRMLSSIANVLSVDAKKIITNRVNQQRDILIEIAREELRIQEVIDGEPKSIMDNNHFEKKQFYIKNI